MKKTNGKLKNMFVGALAGLTLLSGLTFVGCQREPENKDPNGGDYQVPPIIEIVPKTAESLTDLETRYPEKLENFVGAQLDKVLEDLEIEENVVANYQINTNETGITSIEFTFEYNHHSYTATANYSTPITFDKVAEYEEHKNAYYLVNDAIEASTTQHEKEYILNHVDSLENLKETYPEKVKQFLNTQFAYAFENKGFVETETNKVKDRTEVITADENGVQKVEYTYTFNGREQNLSVEYLSPIPLDTLANYPEHDQSKEQVVESMLSSKIEHEIPLSSYSDQEIISLFQDQINDNLHSALADCAKAFENNNECNINNVTQYRWFLGEITDGKVQNLQVYFEMKDHPNSPTDPYRTTGIYRWVFNVKLKNPTSLTDLAKENNPVEYQKVRMQDLVYDFSLPAEHQEGYSGEWLESGTKTLAQKDTSFDYLNAEFSGIYHGDVNESTDIKFYYSLGNEIRCVAVFVPCNVGVTDQDLLDGINRYLQEGKFEFNPGLSSQFILQGNALDWVEHSYEHELAK